MPGPSYDDLYLDAFYELGTERQLGANGLGPIPLSKIFWFIKENNIEDENFVHIIQALDGVYLNKINLKNKKA